MKEIGITFGEIHSYRDLGLILADGGKEIGSPKPKTYSLEVPYRDGKIDITEADTGRVTYSNRQLKFTFKCIDPMNTWSEKFSKILELFHGKKMKVIDDEDQAFYYMARLNVNTWESNKNIGTIVIECDAEPYKYDINSSAVDWEWDTFDFETGIINDMNQLVISGEVSVILICRQKLMFPTFTVSSAMTLEYEGVTYNLVAGSQKIFDLFLVEGNNELIFKGNGTVTIDYTGGSL